MKTFLGLTVVGWFNMLILQWFCVRLAYSVDPKPNDGSVGFGFLYPIVPLTGWRGRYAPASYRNAWVWFYPNIRKSGA